MLHFHSPSIAWLQSHAASAACQHSRLIRRATPSRPPLHIHMHVYIQWQGLPTSMIVEGAARVWGLLEEVEAALGGRRIRVLDIGGGLR